MAAVNYMFNRRGRVTVFVNKSGATAHVLDKVLDLGIENGAVEMNELDETEKEDVHVMEVKMLD